ncbi:MAG TPA: carboxylesterase/lipase family protein [Acidimicrobiales bacterium]|nr:carboxylesterase/lipase family protein [Acidimicrobiales bacterium]
MIVDTPSGRIRGIEKRGVRQYRGIPYATAERFRAPVPAEPWDGILDADRFGPIAPQNPSPTEALLGAQARPSSEDCLYLNVFAPLEAADPRPVMVWIHGGGFAAGSGDVVWYDGTNLVRRGDVVVVTLNYRLGALGFLHLDHLDPALAGSGTNGIRDQITALAWVRDHIAAFGGDPGNVTVFGESAGGMSTGTLLGTPAARGLFHGAIAQSGACAHVHQPEVAEWVTARVLDALDLSPTAVDGLLAAPVDAILRAQTALDAGAATGDRSGGPGIGVLPFQPVVDGAVIPRPPLDAVAAGGAAGVHVVVGSTLEEWTMFHLRSRVAGALTEDHARRRVGRLVGADRAGDVLDAYRTVRPAADPDALLCAVMTDHVFRQPAIRLAEAQAPHAPRVSMYRFGYPSTAFDGSLGACHGIDVPFVFDNLDRGGVEMLLGGLDDDAHRLAARTSAAWLAAAATGAPDHDDLAWPAFDTSERLTCELDRSAVVAADPDRAIRLLWEELAPRTGPAAATAAAVD